MAANFDHNSAGDDGSINGAAIKVLCVEDSADLAALLRVAIDAEPDMCAVGCLHRADDLVVEVKKCVPDIVLLDLTMPGKNPLEALRDLVCAVPDARAIVFSGHNDQARIDAAIEAGAWGYISKHQEIDQVLDAIRQVAAGQFMVST